MSIVLVGSTSGSITLQEPAVAGTTVLTLPAVTGTILTTTSPKAGNVIQVVSTTKTDTFSSSSSGSWVDITGLSVTITPTSASNRVYVSYSVVSTSNNGWYQQFRLVRGATAIGVADTAGSRISATTAAGLGGASQIDYPVVQSSEFLDSPNTTSATTYKLQMRFGGDTMFINRSTTDSDSSSYYRTISTITVMEIAA
jgi:hypothetical protein